MIDFDEFIAINRKFPLMLFPAFRLQDYMQKSTLGMFAILKYLCIYCYLCNLCFISRALTICQYTVYSSLDQVITYVFSVYLTSIISFVGEHVWHRIMQEQARKKVS